MITIDVNRSTHSTTTRTGPSVYIAVFFCFEWYFVIFSVFGSVGRLSWLAVSSSVHAFHTVLCHCFCLPGPCLVINVGCARSLEMSLRKYCLVAVVGLLRAGWFLSTLLTVFEYPVKTSSTVQLELKMFYQTFTACKPPKPSPAGTVWCRERIHCRGMTGALCAFSVPGDLDLWPLTLAIKLIQARYRTRLPCEFCANLFSSPRDIWGTHKK